VSATSILLRWIRIRWMGPGENSHRPYHDTENKSENGSEAQQHSGSVHVIRDDHKCDRTYHENDSRNSELLESVEMSCPEYGSAYRQNNADGQRCEE